MIFNKNTALLLVAAGLLDAALANPAGQQGGKGNAGTASNNGGNAGGNGGTFTVPDSALQTASASIGAVNATAGESPSLTSNINFADFCVGQTLTNGLQTKTGSCNGVVMGQIPSVNNMVTNTIQFPENGGTIAANQDFNASTQVSNLIAGNFTNAATTYYSAPQFIDKASGNIIGHVHLTIEQMTSANSLASFDPVNFAFFKGIDNAGNGNGLLTATVAGGLPAGSYRMCTLSSSANHAQVQMPVSIYHGLLLYSDDCMTEH